MSTNSANMSLSDLLSKVTIISTEIKLNPVIIGRFGMELPEYTTAMDADVLQARAIDQDQERLKTELKMKTEELNTLKEKINQSYALAKKTVKMAEPQIKWLAYGIDDKR